jgi:hypothetical protein
MPMFGAGTSNMPMFGAGTSDILEGSGHRPIECCVSQREPTSSTGDCRSRLPFVSFVSLKLLPRNATQRNA